jgi:uncharacterized BrkB/YihY/UPF0761 family membrane protein
MRGAIIGLLEPAETEAQALQTDKRRLYVLTSGPTTVWLKIKWSLITIYHDVYDEHLFVFAAGLSYYFVLSLFPLLVSMAALLAFIPIPHLFE